MNKAHEHDREKYKNESPIQKEMTLLYLSEFSRVWIEKETICCWKRKEIFAWFFSQEWIQTLVHGVVFFDENVHNFLTLLAYKHTNEHTYWMIRLSFQVVWVGSFIVTCIGMINSWIFTEDVLLRLIQVLRGFKFICLEYEWKTQILWRIWIVLVWTETLRLIDRR